MTLRLYFVLFLVVAVLGLAARYLIRRAGETFALGPRVRRALAVILFGALVLTAATRLFENRLPAGRLSALATASITIVLSATISAVLLALVDLVGWSWRSIRWSWRSIDRRSRRRAPEAPPVVLPPPPVTRRSFLAQTAAGSVIAVGSGSSLYGTLVGRHDYTLEEVPVRIAGLARALDGFTIAQLSDIHLGLFVGEREMRAAEDLVRRARPDLIVLTGDLVDHEPREAESLGRLITRLSPLARGGVVAIPGNHDYYTGIGAVTSALTRAGARVLVNDGLVIGGGFALLGLDDVRGPRVDPGSVGPDLSRALSRVPEAKDLPRVVLCHNPVVFQRVIGEVDLMLSGHTHGGQLNLGVRLADVVLRHPFIAGRYERGGSQIYVNRGFGTAGPPARVGSPPEVSRIVLVSG